MHWASGPRPLDSSSDCEAPDELGPIRWSIRHAIELLDEGIERAGEQLARSAGLWGEAPGEKNPMDAGGMGRRRRRDPAGGHGPPLEHESYDAPGGPELP